MGVMIDIIGSTIIRGVIVLVILNLNVSLNNALSQKTARAVVKQKTVVPAQVITDDLRLAGYNTSVKTFSIAKADEVQFSADVNNDGNTETVHYYLGTPDAVSKHRVLYRAVSSINGGAPFELARDVDSLVFNFYDINGGALGPGLNVSNIKSIKVKLLIESNAQVTEGIGTDSAPQYVKAYWERTLFPLNL
jgi:hypothetical protein